MATTKALTPAQIAPPERLAAAEQAYEEAKAAADALRERHQLGEQPGTAREFADAGGAIEAAENELEGARKAFHAYQWQQRVEYLAELRTEIDAGASISAVATAFEAISDGVAELLGLLVPRPVKLREWGDRLHHAPVEPVPLGRVNEPPRPEDGGLGRRMVNHDSELQILVTDADGKVRAIQALDIAKIFDAAVTRGCRQAGHAPALLNQVSSRDTSLVGDPATWFANH